MPDVTIWGPASAGPNPPTPSGDCCTAMASIADLIAAPIPVLVNPTDIQLVTVVGYYGPGTMGGGSFRWDPLSTTTPVQGMVIAPTAGGGGAGRWIRLLIDPSRVNATMFGLVVGDPAAAAINAGAINAGYKWLYNAPTSGYFPLNMGQWGNGGELYLPGGKIYCQTFFVRSMCTLQGAGLSSTLLIPTGINSADRFLIEAEGIYNSREDWVYNSSLKDFQISTDYGNPLGGQADSGGICADMWINGTIERVCATNLTGDAISLLSSQDMTIVDCLWGFVGDGLTNNKVGERFGHRLLNDNVTYGYGTNATHCLNVRHQSAACQTMCGGGWDNVFVDCKWESRFTDGVSAPPGLIHIENTNAGGNYRWLGCVIASHVTNSYAVYLRQGIANFDSCNFLTGPTAYGGCFHIDNSGTAPENQLLLNGVNTQLCKEPLKVTGTNNPYSKYRITGCSFKYIEEGKFILPEYTIMTSTEVVAYDALTSPPTPDIVQISSGCTVTACDFSHRFLLPGRIRVLGNLNMLDNILYSALDGFFSLGATNDLRNVRNRSGSPAPVISGTNTSVTNFLKHPDGIDSASRYFASYTASAQTVPGTVVLNTEFSASVITADMNTILAPLGYPTDINVQLDFRMYKVYLLIAASGAGGWTWTWPLNVNPRYNGVATWVPTMTTNSTNLVELVTFNQGANWRILSANAF